MADNSKKNPPFWEDKQFIIAIVFIAGFFLLMAISLAQYYAARGVNLDAVKTIGAIFGGWVGAIIGFYFGQKPAEQERQRTKDLTDKIITQSREMWEKVKESLPKREE
jgi:glycopeptide antibiotics resistance protein